MSEPQPSDNGTPQDPQASLRRRVWSSGGWSIGRVAITGTTQFATLVILLRLLETTDFGALSVVMVVLTLTQAFTQTGVDLALVRERGDISPWLSPYFSLQVARGVVLGVVIALLAYPISIWQESPVLADYLLVVSLVPILEGLRGVSSLIYVRNLEQRVPTIVDGTCAVLGLASLTALAIWLRSPWAVIINQLFTTGIRSLAYHLCSPIRVKLTRDWNPLRRFFRFGVGFNLAQTSGTLIDTIDRLLIGRHLGFGSLGLYDRSAALANYGLYLLPQFFSTVVVPAFAGIAGDRRRFWRVARRYLLWVTFAGAIGTGLVRIGDRFLLSIAAGDKAAELLPFFRILLLCAFLRGIGWLAQALLDILGRPQLRATINVAHVAVIVLGLSLVLANGELWQVCIVALCGSAVSALLSVGTVVALARRMRRAECESFPAPAAGIEVAPTTAP